ncbi:MAG: acyl--CoA ligase [bacterium]|nr:acyl--CoA ligase [bacterium]
MSAAGPAGNFAGTLIEGLGTGVVLVDARRNQSLTGSELGAAVQARAARMQAAGVAPGDRVLLLADLDVDTAVTYMATIYRGAVVVPVERVELKRRREALVAKARPAAYWCSREKDLDLGPEGCPATAAALEPHGEVCVAPGPATAPAALMMTSGSTGEPEFVVVSHDNLLANTRGIVATQGLVPEDRAMLVLPLSYCFGASVFHSHLMAGGAVVLDDRFMFPDKVLDAIGTHGCTSFAGVPTAYRFLEDRSGLFSRSLPSMRRFLQAGGPLGFDVVERYRVAFPQAAFYVMYGQTEATARITSLRIEDDEYPAGYVGELLPGLEARVVGEDGADVGPGELGELCVRGGSITSGYWENPAKTAERFSGGWLHTGDLVVQDSGGGIAIRGRKGGFLKFRGRRVGLVQLEDFARQDPGIRDCAVAGVADPETGEAAGFLIVPEGDEDVLELEQRLRGAFPAEWRLAGIHVVPEIPRTGSGKPARNEVRKAVEAALCPS